MQNFEVSKRYGLVGSFLFGALLILLLFLIKLSYRYVDELDNMELSQREIVESYSGRSRGGSSFYKPEKQEVLKPVASSANTEVTKSTANPQPINTQDIEESLELERKAEAERKARAAEAAAEAERQRIEAEKRAKADAAKNLASGAFSGGKGTGGAGSGSSSGTGSGSNPTGNPVGSGSSNGNSWSLTGRGLVGSIAKPSYRANEMGFIIVEIRVDEKGNVTSAKISKSEITDESLRNSTLESAKRAKFTPGKGVVYGQIRYNFRLN